MACTVLPRTVLSSRFLARSPPPSSHKQCRRFRVVYSSQNVSFNPLSKEQNNDRRIPSPSASAHHVLCLSNGHGEDSIAVTVLKELEATVTQRGRNVVIEALPLVGLGSAYRRAGIPIVGNAKVMPSGGFIYMDILQLLGDLRAGLLSLTLEQWRTILQWLDEKPDGFIIAVGDIFPLVLAWLASRHTKRKERKEILGYAFIGTAKSEFYIQEDVKTLPNCRVESLLGGVYLPWECALMADSSCRLVAPRDSLTAKVLKRQLPSSAQAKVQDLGNPMMDGLHPTGALNFLERIKPGRFITILPGSRAPEVHANWRLLLKAAAQIAAVFYTEKVVFLTPIVPSLELEPFSDALVEADWHPRWLESSGKGSVEIFSSVKGQEIFAELWQPRNNLPILAFDKSNAIVLLLRGGFNDASHWAEAGIAMAGTGTEQLVGLGKPVFTLPGDGPQFTFAFAEAQSRLLGKSIFLCHDTQSLAMKLWEVLTDKACLAEVAENGVKRMGKPGSGQRIAQQLCLCMFKGVE